MSLTVLCAASGEGKTTFLHAQVERLRAERRSVGGVLSPAVFERERHIGYDLIDLRSGERRPLARLAARSERVVTTGTAPMTGPTAGVYRFDEGALREGNEAIVAALRDGVEIIAIDEIGPLELRGQGWTPALETALLLQSAHQHLILTARPSVAEALSARFPSPHWAGARLICPPWPANLEF